MITKIQLHCKWGSEYDDLNKCAKIAYELNYNEINLNVGCPSKAVQKEVLEHV